MHLLERHVLQRQRGVGPLAARHVAIGVVAEGLGTERVGVLADLAGHHRVVDDVVRGDATGGDGIADLSQIVFGCASVGGRVGPRASVRAMEFAFDQGVSGFDVARSYGYGDAERILGGFLRGKRDRCVVVSKAGIQSMRPDQVFNSSSRRLALTPS